MNCYCRGAGTCTDCGGHICTGQCACNQDGATQTQAEITAGYVNPSIARLEAWAQKLELSR